MDRDVRPSALRALRWLIVAVAALASLTTDGSAQTASNEAEVKAAFVYNFLKFVDWPAHALPKPDQPFAIAIVGEGAVADAAETLLKGKRISVYPLVVVRVKAGEPLSDVHAVFVTGADPEKARRTLATRSNASILTIGDDAQFATRGGVIGLYVEDRRVRFEVNTDAADATGLRVSSRLLALARLVRSSANGQGARP